MQPVTIVQLKLPGSDLLIVDQGAVSAVEVADEHFVLSSQQSAVAFADVETCRPQLTVGIAANDELRPVDGYDDFAQKLAWLHNNARMADAELAD